MKDIVRSINLAIVIICCLAFGFAVGYFADALLKTSPVFMVVGLLLGTALAFMYLYQWSKKR